DGTDPIPDLVQLRDDLNDIKTPDPSYTPDRPIDKPGDMTRDLQARVMTHLDEKAQDDVHDLLSDGKIIEESGQNENGRYVRFADGTQICWKDNVVTYTSESPNWVELGTLYRSTGVTVVYPASFSSTPVLIPRIRRTGGNIYPWPGPQTGAGTSQADMHFISH